jgi:hypothetical protein
VSFDLGDVVTIFTTITDPSTGLPANASSVSVVVTRPDQTTASPVVTNPTTGRYEATFTAAQAGLHGVLWTATGTNAGVFADVVDVDDTTVSAQPIVGLSDVKRYLRIPVADVSRDEEIRDVLKAATDLCERATKRVFRRTVVTETHDGGRVEIILRRQPVLSVTSVTALGAPVTVFTLDRVSGILYFGSTSGAGWWPWGLQNIVVTYVAGATAVAPSVTEAVLVTTEHLWQPRRGGSNLPRQAGADSDYPSGAPWALPRRAEQLLDDDNDGGYF